MSVDLSADFHVHSNYSDGRNSLAANLAVAERASLTSLGFADHVRSDTAWLAAYVADIRELDARSPVSLIAGVEAKLLDPAGSLDLPDDLCGVERILVADHQVPLAEGPTHPAKVKQMLDAGTISRADVLRVLIGAIVGAAERYENVTVAHLFSVLPKCGIDPDGVDLRLVEELGCALASCGAAVEISERWRCPSLEVAAVLQGCAVTLVASTDSHRASAIGRYDFVADVVRGLA